MADRKMRYAVLTHFENRAGTRVGNKAKFQWDADGLLESYTYEEIKDVIDYYFNVGSAPVWKNFLYKFDEYKKAMADAERDRIARKRNLKKMMEWMSE